MGIDFGDARTGIAICDKNELLASPICVIHETDWQACMDQIAKLTAEYKVEQLVVGYPKNMNGTIGERAEKCQLFASSLSELTNLPFVMWDERCTTVSAHQYLNVTNTL